MIERDDDVGNSVKSERELKLTTLKKILYRLL